MLSALIGEANRGWTLRLVDAHAAFEAGRMGARMSHKAVAHGMGLSESHLSQQLNLHGLNFTRMLWLPDTFLAPAFKEAIKRTECAHLLAEYQPSAVSQAEVEALRRQVAELTRAVSILVSADRRTA